MNTQNQYSTDNIPETSKAQIMSTIEIHNLTHIAQIGEGGSDQVIQVSVTEFYALKTLKVSPSEDSKILLKKGIPAKIPIT
ncbi:hypothetical protein TRFO_04834 [Tritrichomonas foetus]|uniref:Uncharacterized protein n=1 Tax=Tritrichomonas foetus TaxID=1144522 RepID=A0A1J4KGE9_9EUKA|nr:hypothetical protein TRFO_04834 [Tritrichomonas foetus]|eukprot:OHT08734.1 hypothetical protein TRFO_04834 [Tritrichomonas foetus]